MLIFSGINGWLTSQVAHNLVHNRTANTWGIPGRNIPLDLLCEHSNNDFKGNFSHHIHCINIQNCQIVLI